MKYFETRGVGVGERPMSTGTLTIVNSGMVTSETLVVSSEPKAIDGWRSQRGSDEGNRSTDN